MQGVHVLHVLEHKAPIGHRAHYRYSFVPQVACIDSLGEGTRWAFVAVELAVLAAHSEYAWWLRFIVIQNEPHNDAIGVLRCSRRCARLIQATYAVCAHVYSRA